MVRYPVTMADPTEPEGAAPEAGDAAPAAKPARKRAPRKKAAPPAAELQPLILSRLDEDKAEDIVAIDLKGKSPLADWIVVASGRSARHVAALADHLVRALKENGYGKARVEGLPQADWVLIDVGDVIVHLFRPEVRAFYQIEKIWSVDSAHQGRAGA